MLGLSLPLEGKLEQRQGHRAGPAAEPPWLDSPARTPGSRGATVITSVTGLGCTGPDPVTWWRKSSRECQGLHKKVFKRRLFSGPLVRIAARMTYRFTAGPSCTRTTRERAEGRRVASLQGPSKVMPAEWQLTRQVCATVTVGSFLPGDNRSVYVLPRGLGPDVSPRLSPATPPAPLPLPTPPDPHHPLSLLESQLPL